MEDNEIEETMEDDKIKCPYCGYEDEESESIYNIDDGDEYECDDCRKKFNVSVYTSTTFTATPDCFLNGEEHVFSDGDCDICSCRENRFNRDVVEREQDKQIKILIPLIIEALDDEIFTYSTNQIIRIDHKYYAEFIDGSWNLSSGYRETLIKHLEKASSEEVIEELTRLTKPQG